MTIEDALIILEINEPHPNLNQIKSAYRVLARKYHPDKTGTKDASKFILINAAYELLKDHFAFGYSSYEHEKCDAEFETESDISARLREIEKAFELLQRSYEEYHNAVFANIENQIIEVLNSYTTNSQLKNHFPSYFSDVTTNGLQNIVVWFNENFASMAKSYDTWINGYLKSVYEQLQAQETALWRKSPFLRKTIKISFFVSLISVPIGIYLNNNLLLLLFPIYFGIPAGIIKYFRSVRSSFSIEERVIRLDHNKFRLSPEQAQLYVGEEVSQKETSQLGAVSGAALGLAVGGPIGAVIGGALGGLFGSMFGESLDELKNKVYSQANIRLVEINSFILERLNNEIPKIYSELINSVKENYSKNKKNAVNLLLTYNTTYNKTHAYKIEKDHPMINIDFTDMIYVVLLACFFLSFTVYISEKNSLRKLSLTAPSTVDVRNNLQNEVMSFISTHLNFEAKQEIESYINDYEEVVDYYSTSKVTKNQIKQLKLAFYKKWPMVSYNLDRKTFRINEEGGQIRIFFNYHFIVGNDIEKREGVAENEMEIYFKNGVIKIIAEEQKILHTENKTTKNEKYIEPIDNYSINFRDPKEVIRAFYLFVEKKKPGEAVLLYAEAKKEKVNKKLIDAVSTDTEYYKIESMIVNYENDVECEVSVYLFHKKHNAQEEYWAINVKLIKESDLWKIWSTPGKQIY
ncbi:DnaJ domain-containing protein [bacterium]|nr:DnaJ domain-containing protein [bacterium]NUN45022.1 DnaJ domain-containing protein [bacterium]